RRVAFVPYRRGVHGSQAGGLDTGLLAELSGRACVAGRGPVTRSAFVAVGALTALAAVGCTQAPHRPPPTRTSVSPSPSGPPAVRLPAIELQAYLSERPGRWEQVVTIPFGTDVSSLAFGPAHEAPTVEPSSFAIGPDGTIWILDAGNAR